MEVTIIDDVEGGIFQDATVFHIYQGLNTGGWGYNLVYSSGEGNALMRVDLSAYAGFTVVSGYYSMYLASGSDVVEVGVYPLLKEWGEGTGVFNAANVGECTGASARHTQELWDTSAAMGAGVDHSNTAAAIEVLPAVLGYHILNISAASIQAKIDNHATNYGDIVRPVIPGGNHEARWFSSDSASKPFFYMEYTEAAEEAALCSRARMVNL
ncbi:hypothetical protein KAR91_33470 [Candidatus Pacearchaeota archaeon]|nr:hypothetical protein [Candidatus Pacearchaeota archaeon]